MKDIFKVSIIALSVQLGACSWFDSDDDSSNADLVTKYDGVWLAEAYGEGIKIGNGIFMTFDYTSDYCLVEDEDTIDSEADIDEVIYSADSEHFKLIAGYGTKDFHSPGKEYTKTANGLMPSSCENGFIAQQGESGYQRDVVRDLDLFFQTFAEYYVSFELTGTDWNAIYNAAAAEVDSDTSDVELFDVLYNAIAALKDSHVSVTSPDIGVASVNNEPVMWEQLLNEYAEQNNLSLPIPAEHSAAVNEYIGDNIELYEAIIETYAEDESDIKTDGVLKWFKNEGVGYLEIGAMVDVASTGNLEDIEADIAAAKSAIESALTDLSDTDALILDVRMNNGGRDVISMAFASYFIESAGTFAQKSVTDQFGVTTVSNYDLTPAAQTYTKPTFILTSASTVSAAETFVILLKAQDHIATVGQPTQGALSDILDKTLPNGFMINLSNEKYLTTDGEWYERTGIPVDVQVPHFDLESRELVIDKSIETVLAILSGE
ncbi:S41 family peptidase [Psychrosphaera sp. 1_MG-2023]|uniref:S41 family peptidase n=1 Tax=Psychrosphaera sp. 1_MG-2023 TaxID=3062643 RepID=UPI0026E15E49|nr:S41 family peptidase [Psychrosphaera sp. 1_MG-2023]MDO6720931.1 S41 family peptidase [Psychrosphaera sp. 1_MG-2023]